MNASDEVVHPGLFIKSKVIPTGMSVTKAAELLGVGRPALSNLLNGNSSLSLAMAKRLEKAFDCSSEKLMSQQTRYNELAVGESGNLSTAKAYVPPYLKILARDISEWAAGNVGARTRFPVLLRTLVNSTGSKLTEVDFPGNDDGERPGWDGAVMADEGTPWVPLGRSGWEFGTNKNNIKQKADHDFRKSVIAVTEDERRDMTFVFVTPHAWKGKSSWLAEKKKDELWKDVRAYDSSDLEQWLEQSIPAQAWFANEARLNSEGVRTLDDCWKGWSGVCTPALPGALFQSAVEAAKGKMEQLLASPPEGPILITADSVEEALAFLAQLFSDAGGEALVDYRDYALIFDKPTTLSRLSNGKMPLIPIVYDRKVEMELASISEKMHSIVIYPRNALVEEPDIRLDPVRFDVFERALKSIGKGRDDISLLAHESGRSLTVLRRRMANVPAVRRPVWSRDTATARRLIPFFLVGSWFSDNESDKVALELIAGGVSYSDRERSFKDLALINDSPVWSIGSRHGVVSKKDLLYSISYALTAQDLENYFGMAQCVLGEDDPALDFPEDQQWLAAFQGKVREFSNAFREGVADTLVLLAVSGKDVFERGLRSTIDAGVRGLVRQVLPTPLTVRCLNANNDDLPTYAEAAPAEFLDILEEDLESSMPASIEILTPQPPGAFSRPKRTGLLWALEGLAWSHETVDRSVMILGRLAEVEIEDNWANKPLGSLESIFRSWMPQTAAPLEMRIRLIRRLAEKFPKVAWKICNSLIDQFGRVGTYSHKPRWRDDGYGYGEPLPDRDVWQFERAMATILLSRGEYTAAMLSDLVDRLRDFTKDEVEVVWRLIVEWSGSSASDLEKAELMEEIRKKTLSSRVFNAYKARGERPGYVSAAKEVIQHLRPKDVVLKNLWLFRSGWVDESAEELQEIERINFDERDRRIEKQRVNAVLDIFDKKGVEGIFELSKLSGVPRVVGSIAIKCLPREDAKNLVLKAVSSVESYKSSTFSSCIELTRGALHTYSCSEDCQLMDLIDDLDNDVARLSVLLLCPFRIESWNIVRKLSDGDQVEYWRRVETDYLVKGAEGRQEAVARLMDVGRHAEAFNCVGHDPKGVGVLELYKLLEGIPESAENEKKGMIDSYLLVRAIEYLCSSSNLTFDQKVALELRYLDVLVPYAGSVNGVGVPNLEQYMVSNPDAFVPALIWSYNRADHNEDPDKVDMSPEQIREYAKRGHKLLNVFTKVPGEGLPLSESIITLRNWVKAIRSSSNKLSRLEVADICLGRVLAKGGVGGDGVWPGEAVREVLEDIGSRDMVTGVHSGAFNSRGVTTRSPWEGGDQERELAAKYRGWGNRLMPKYPFVATNLLLSLAETYDEDARRFDEDAGIRLRLL